tara:strand:+ start:9828 stop:10211 length:384 start_codon:yes stop_codon:yes gene_type:complete
MGNQVIIPKVVTDKTTKADVPFWVIEAEDDNYTVWDAGIKDTLLANLNKGIAVEIKVSGDYKNIRAIAVQDGLEVAQEAKGSKPGPSRDDMKQKSIVAQCLTKLIVGEGGADVKKVVDTYHEVLGLI